MKIITITPNPSIDATYHVTSLLPNDTNRSTAYYEQAGGKGVNVSRVLHAMHIPTLALGIAGRDNSVAYEKHLLSEDLPFHFLFTNGQIRRNITICQEDGTCYKINEPGPSVDPSALMDLKGRLRTALKGAEFCVFSGSLPRGMGVEDVYAIADQAEKRRVHLVLDVDFLSLSDVGTLHPWLIKPNYYELCRLTGSEPHTLDELCESALKVQRGGAEHVLLTLGADGMILVTPHELFLANVPRVPVKNTTGAGDTALAAFLATCGDNLPFPECLRFAAACSVARVAKDDLSPVVKSDAAPFLPDIKVSARSLR